MRRVFLFIPLVLTAMLCFLLWLGLGQNPNDHDSAALGRPLPDLTLPDLMQPQQPIALAALRGEAFVLNVWASWCANCRNEHPLLIRLAGQVPLYGLNYRDKPEAARAWLGESGNPFRAVFDDQQGKLALELGVYGTPETLLFSADGILIARYTGVLTDEVWQKIFVPLLTSTDPGKVAS